MPHATLALEGNSALVTGGGSGIGLACARYLLRDGATVTIAGRSEEKLRQAAATLEPDIASGAAVRTVACDVTDESAVEAAVQTAATAGRLDIADANAGGGAAGPIVGMSLDELRAPLAGHLSELVRASVRE